MDRALIKFNNFLDVANAYKTNNQLYMFLRDCAFRGIYEFISSNICADDMKNHINQLYGEFQNEIAQYQWNFFTMQKETYNQFLEFFYSNINFDSASEKLLTVCIDLLDNQKYFGNFDNLSLQRIEYFNKKINALKAPQFQQKQPTTQVQSPQVNNNVNKTPTQPQPSAQQQPKQPNRPFVPILNNGNVPKKVRRDFQLPMSKKDPNYAQLSTQILEHIEYATLELDYHKVGEAREHLEAVVFYLKILRINNNIIITLNVKTLLLSE